MSDSRSLLHQSEHGPAWPPLRSVLAEYYRRVHGSDWRDYYEGPYTDDGTSRHEDCDHCFGSRSEHWEDCDEAKC